MRDGKFDIFDMTRYQVDSEKDSECEACHDVRPVTDVERQSVDAVERRREDECQSQEWT